MVLWSRAIATVLAKESAVLPDFFVNALCCTSFLLLVPTIPFSSRHSFWFLWRRLPPLPAMASFTSAVFGRDEAMPSAPPVMSTSLSSSDMAFWSIFSNSIWSIFLRRLKSSMLLCPGDMRLPVLSRAWSWASIALLSSCWMRFSR